MTWQREAQELIARGDGEGAMRVLVRAGFGPPPPDGLHLPQGFHAGQTVIITGMDGRKTTAVLMDPVEVGDLKRRAHENTTARLQAEMEDWRADFSRMRRQRDGLEEVRRHMRRRRKRR